MRNKAWIRAPLLDLLRARRAALVLVDLPYMPHPLDLGSDLDLVTAEFSYVRLIGDRQAVEAATSTFDRIVLDKGASLERWADWLVEQCARVRETFAYANNHFAGHGPATIRDLARRMQSKQG